MLATTLIIDKRRELSIKYKKLIESSENKVIISNDLTEALKLIQNEEPDLILVSDTIEEELAAFCKQVRILTYNMRPVIVALSKSSEILDRVKILESGADDFIGEPVNSDELKMRIIAHLRREAESNMDLKMGLPTKEYTLKALKRVLNNTSPWAVMQISIENFKNYKDNYTELASDKLFQTFSAILKSSINENDFLGSFSASEIIVITNPERAEKIASFLTFAFDSVAKKFYSKDDAQRGYMIVHGDDYAGRRAEFVYTVIGVVTNEFSRYDDVKQLLASLNQVHSMAKTAWKSNFMIERPKLSAADSVVEKIFNKRVLVIEQDEALSLLLKTVLNLQGYDVETAETNSVSNSIPAVLIIDAGDVDTKNGLDFCRAVKSNPFFAGTKIIMTSIFHEKELILNSGADLYLPKPYELSHLVKWVELFIREFNA